MLVVKAWVMPVPDDQAKSVPHSPNSARAKKITAPQRKALLLFRRRMVFFLERTRYLLSCLAIISKP